MVGSEAELDISWIKDKAKPRISILSKHLLIGLYI